MWPLTILQRGYAFAVLALQGLFRLRSPRFFDFKATIVMVALQALLVLGVLYVASVLSGHLLEVLNDRATFRNLSIAVGAALFLINRRAEIILLPRFEQQYLALQKKYRVLTTIAVLSGFAVVVAGTLLAREVARGLR